MKVILATVLFASFFLFVEGVSKKFKIHKETSRKIVHICAGTLAAFLPFIMTFQEIMYLSLLFVPTMVISKRLNFFSSIHQVKRNTYGEVYFPVAIFMTALLFQERHLFMYGVLIMSVSDGFASVFGQKYGQAKYRILQGEKSYIGSTVFLASTFLIGLVLVPAIHLLDNFAVSLLLTFAEACLSEGLDNLVLPPLAALLLSSLV